MLRRLSRRKRALVGHCSGCDRAGPRSRSARPCRRNRDRSSDVAPSARRLRRDAGLPDRPTPASRGVWGTTCRRQSRDSRLFVAGNDIQPAQLPPGTRSSLFEVQPYCKSGAMIKWPARIASWTRSRLAGEGRVVGLRPGARAFNRRSLSEAPFPVRARVTKALAHGGDQLSGPGGRHRLDRSSRECREGHADEWRSHVFDTLYPVLGGKVRSELPPYLGAQRNVAALRSISINKQALGVLDRRCRFRSASDRGGNRPCRRGGHPFIMSCRATSRCARSWCPEHSRSEHRARSGTLIH